MALPSPHPAELRTMLVDEAKKWDESRIAERADRVLAQAGSTPESIDQWFKANGGVALTDEERARAEDDPKTVIEDKIAAMLRMELTQFERWVLLQIVDQAWKDHLHGMDQLRDSIGLRSFAQKDSRIEFKREGAKLFEEMYQTIRDKVTDLVFKAKLTPQVAAPQRSPQPPLSDVSGLPDGGSRAEPKSASQQASGRAAQPAIAAAAAASASVGTASQRRDLEVAERAGAPAVADRAVRKAKPAKAVITVGRNEPCPCGSGKKYKQCCGKRN